MAWLALGSGIMAAQPTIWVEAWRATPRRVTALLKAGNPASCAGWRAMGHGRGNMHPFSAKETAAHIPYRQSRRLEVETLGFGVVSKRRCRGKQTALKHARRACLIDPGTATPGQVTLMSARRNLSAALGSIG